MSPVHRREERIDIVAPEPIPGSKVVPTLPGISRRSLPAVVAIGVGALLVVLSAWLLGAVSPLVGIITLLGTALLIVSLWDPYWGVVLLVAQFAVLPCPGKIFGREMPAVLQVAIPAILILALLAFLRSKRKLPVSAADVLIGLLAAWGLIGLSATPGLNRWKAYGKGFAYPMGIYSALRVLPLSHRKVVQALNLNLIAFIYTAFFVVYRHFQGSSAIYGRQWGPFTTHFAVSPYMALWPVAFVYGIHRARSGPIRALNYLGLFFSLFASTCTEERAGLLAIVGGLIFLLISPQLRPTVRNVLVVGAIAYIPWSMSEAGGTLLARFDLNDQSREAYNAIGWNIIKGSHWNPLFGIGFRRGRDLAPTVTGGKEYRMWGTRWVSLTTVGKMKKPVHNMALALLMEFGIVGALLGIGIILCLVRSLWYCLGARARLPNVDAPLATTFAGMVVSGALVSYFHNTYTFVPFMSVFWFAYGVVVGHTESLVEEPVEEAPVGGKQKPATPVRAWVSTGPKAGHRAAKTPGGRAKPGATNVQQRDDRPKEVGHEDPGGGA